MIPASTPEPPYYAVIFTSLLQPTNIDDYAETADLMVALAKQQAGFLGVESARENLGITVSYWQDMAAIKAWKRQTDHVIARRHGREKWYQTFQVRIAKVETAYVWKK